MTQVAVVGAGPAGLMLAGELATLGVSVRIFEKRAGQFGHSRAFGLQPRSLEILDQRGRLDTFLRRGVASPVVSLGKEGSLTMEVLDIPHPYMLIIPQLDTETALTEWVSELGVGIERSTEVTGLAQDGGSVTLDLRTPDGDTKASFDYVVGCDGGQSTVRRILGIDFRGKGSEFSAIIADVSLGVPPPDQVFARHSRRGMVALMPFRDGTYRLVVQDNTRMHVDPSVPATLDEVAESARAILGIDLDPGSPQWISRFRSEQRLASTYRSGRVFLAGDAAHLHSPAGGQGINVGMQDAFNLGWKLATVIHGWGPETLLGTYETELRPIAKKVLRLSGVIFRFNTATSPPARALQRLVKEVLLRSKSAQRATLGDLAGTDLVYKGALGDAAERGGRVHDMPLVCDGGPTTLLGLLGANRFVLVTDEADALVALGLAGQVRDSRVVTATYPPDHTGPRHCLLVRPDGHAAVATKSMNPDTVRTALQSWCFMSQHGLSPEPARSR
ncbi:MAG: FAD-dependent monooxygenase [Actinomycetota bacterium]|nr:FAD-dependent monooxygenase [Actinomycetota bacterium]